MNSIASVDKDTHARRTHRPAFRGVIVLDMLTPINEDNETRCRLDLGKPCVLLSSDANNLAQFDADGKGEFLPCQMFFHVLE